LYGSYTRAFELNFLITVVGILAMAFATLPRPRDTAASVANAA